MRDIKEKMEVRLLPAALRAAEALVAERSRVIRLRLSCSKPKNRACATGLTGRVQHRVDAGLIPAGAANSWPRGPTTRRPDRSVMRALKHGRRLMSPV